MSFSCLPVDAQTFASLDELFAFAAAEENFITTGEISKLLERGAEFFDDHSFGLPGEAVQFNEEGMRAFCGLVGVPFTILASIEKPGLATDLLNDFVRNREVQEKLDERLFVVNETFDTTVMGVVSKTYRTYSNLELCNDVKTFLESNGSKSDLTFHSASVVNSQLRLRVLKRVEHGQVTGSGGKGEDRSEIGLQVGNSMVGDTAVSIQFFIERLLCANGLIAPVSHTENRVFHSGKRENFAKRLHSKIRGVLAGTEGTIKMFEDLRDVEFDPMALAKEDFTAEILDVIPAQRHLLKQAGKGVTFEKDVPKIQRRWERERLMIEAVPDAFGGEHSAAVFESSWRNNASMFDFVNIFTEEAKSLETSQRVVTEERAGVLANRICNNKSKFPKLSR